MEFNYWPLCERLLPHAKSAANFIAELDIPSKEAGRLLNEAASYSHDRGQYDDAEQLYKQALSIREEVLGPIHPDLAESLNNLASLYRDEGRYDEMEPLSKRALSIYEQSLGPDHIYVASSLNNLALL